MKALDSLKCHGQHFLVDFVAVHSDSAVARPRLIQTSRLLHTYAAGVYTRHDVEHCLANILTVGNCILQQLSFVGDCRICSNPASMTLLLIIR